MSNDLVSYDVIPPLVVQTVLRKCGVDAPLVRIAVMKQPRFEWTEIQSLRRSVQVCAPRDVTYGLTFAGDLPEQLEDAHLGLSNFAADVRVVRDAPQSPLRGRVDLGWLPIDRVSKPAGIRFARLEQIDGVIDVEGALLNCAS